MIETVIGDDGLKRCSWCMSDDFYIRYHDQEWGFPVADDRRLFEKLSLEAFQSGLSWRTILVKRENFRSAFRQFDFNKVAKFTDKDVERLLQDAGIVRHRGKIEATINNAKQAVIMKKEYGSLAAFFWSYEPKKKRSTDSIPNQTDESKAMSKALKKLGWKFVGPTTCYAFMQSMGLVNDHLKDCHSYKQVSRARANFTVPVAK
jgi:DNA-3-methyladenine glycosylase I